MVKVLEEGADLSEYEVKECTASGAIHGSRMVEVIRGEKKLAVQVADCPLKPLEKRDEEEWGHYLRGLVHEVCEAKRVFVAKHGNQVSSHLCERY